MGRPGDHSTLGVRSVEPSLAEAAREALARHPHFRARVDRFEFSERSGAIIVRGEVPTFYLKQLVQCILRRLDCVERVENRLAVVCCNGVSSA